MGGWSQEQADAREDLRPGLIQCRLYACRPSMGRGDQGLRAQSGLRGQAEATKEDDFTPPLPEG